MTTTPVPIGFRTHQAARVAEMLGRHRVFQLHQQGGRDVPLFVWPTSEIVRSGLEHAICLALGEHLAALKAPTDCKFVAASADAAGLVELMTLSTGRSGTAPSIVTDLLPQTEDVYALLGEAAMIVPILAIQSATPAPATSTPVHPLLELRAFIRHCDEQRIGYSDGDWDRMARWARRS